MNDEMGMIEDPVVMSMIDDEFEIDEAECRGCGCTNSDPCPGGCIWVDESLCSQCARKGIE